MSGNTTIEWCEKCWNPLRGCSVYTKECLRCYAMILAHRYSGEGGPFEGLTKVVNGSVVWTGIIHLLPKELLRPLTWRKPSLVFVNSMSDLFHEDVPEEFIQAVFGAMKRAHWHTFQILTKRAERLLELSDRLPWSANVWMGVSIGCQATAYKTSLLAKTGAALKWISAEPLLERVEMDLTNIDWMVIGGESGARSRPMDPEWARSLVEQCRAAGTVPFVKQMGTQWAKTRYRGRWMSEDYKGKRIETWEEDLRIREYPRIASPQASPALPRLRRIRRDVARAAARKAWETRRARAALALQSSGSNTKPSV